MKTPNTQKNKKYVVLSPDNFTIEFQPAYYRSKKQCLKALDSFISRYSLQGYYSSVNYGRIPLNEIKQYCTIIEK